MRSEGMVMAMAETRELTLVIDSDIDDELTAIARSTGRDKRSLAREALVEWLEDQEDIRDAQAIIAQDNPSISLEEVKRSLGLAN
jgi:RHH-type transcriptional regulator, rel operon repressor / antitoxin RelB